MAVAAAAVVVLVLGMMSPFPHACERGAGGVVGSTVVADVLNYMDSTTLSTTFFYYNHATPVKPVSMRYGCYHAVE